MKMLFLAQPASDGFHMWLDRGVSGVGAKMIRRKNSSTESKTGNGPDPALARPPANLECSLR